MKTIHLHFRKTDRWLWLLFLAGISLALSLSTTVRAQTCPAGWTSVANGTIYPVSVTGTANSGSINNILFGGADGNAVLAGLGVIVNFGQVLAAGGTIDVSVKSGGPTNPANFNISFSTDGTNFSTPILVTVPATTTTVTKTLTAPQAFQYVKLTYPSNSYTGYDAISYTGAFCKPPLVNYADCSSGQGQIRATITPGAASYPWSIGKPGTYGLMGPDANATPLTATDQNVIVKFQKALSAGDSVQITGSKYDTSVGDFTVLTSLDGVNFAVLQNASFTKITPLLETIIIRSTQPFQYVKVVPSGSGQVTIDAISAFGKTCVDVPETCPLAYTPLTPTTILSKAYTGTVSSILVQDGTAASFNLELIVDFGQTILGGADINVVATSSSGSSSFKIDVSSDNVIFSPIGITTGSIASTTPLQLYKFYSPINFRYVRMTPTAGVIKVDYLGATGVSCPACDVTGAGEAVQAGCIATGGVNANAALTLSSYGGGATKVGYSVGSGYTGADFSSATALTAAPMTLVNTLPNPVSDQPYTIRVFQNSTCYKDIAVILKPQVCLTSDISVSVSPLSQTAASGETQTYIVTVTNAGPDPSSGVKIEVPIPVNRTFLSASPQQGTYTESTQLWDVGNLAVGSKTLTLTIKVN